VPELFDEIKVHNVEVHSNTQQEESHPDEDERQEDGVHGAWDTIQVIGEPSNECEEKGTDNDTEPDFGKARVSSDLFGATIDVRSGESGVSI